MLSFSRLIQIAATCLGGAISLNSIQAAPAFSVPGFVDEEIYKGNGMITMQFDFAGRLWVTEKNGRLLIFDPNPNQPTPFSYQYFEQPAGAPEWKTLPDFSSLTAVQSGVVSSFSVQPKLRNDNYALKFTGTLPIPETGSYTFYLASDDGSRLFIDDKIVIANDGLHGAAEKPGSVQLTSGPHQIRVEYFNRDGGQSLEVLYEGPGVPKGPVTASFFKAPRVFTDLSKEVNTQGERGLLGLALDPDFKKNHSLYVLYSTDKDQHISRLTANADFSAMEPGSEKILLSGLPNLNPVHKAGDIAFLPNEPENLYVVIGDDGDRNQVADLDKYWGKILRIRATDGKGLSSNPFFNGDEDSTRSKVWSYGYRNPFRFAFDPAQKIPGVLYLSENGDGTDRLLRVEKGAVGGWPDAFEKSSDDGKRIILQTSDPSKTGIAIIRDGPFGKDGPILYNARYGGGERNEVRRWKMTGDKLDKLEEIPEDQGKPFYKGYTDYNIVSFTPGPDGAIYYTDSNQGDSLGTNYRLGRLRFINGVTPVTNFTSTSAFGIAPLEVAFTDSSTTSKGQITSWNWDFGDGEVSTQKNPKHRYEKPGVYTALLKATNDSGLNQSKQVSITATHRTVLSLKGQILDARSLNPTPLAVPTDLRVYQLDGITPLPFEGGKGPDQNVIPIRAGGKIEATLPLEITETGVTISAGESETDGVLPVWVGIPLSFTSQQDSVAPVFELSNTVIRGRTLDTKHRPAQVDIGLSKDSEGAAFAFAGGRDFLPSSGKKPSGAAHRIVPDALGYYHIALPSGIGSATFSLDTGADSLVSTHGKVMKSVQVNEGRTTVQNFTIGLYDGGTDKADLSGIPVIPGIDFEKQIQPIFTSSCVACHNGIATNTGGLDLSANKSFPTLVNHLSSGAPGVKWVDPGFPDRSFLMEKINASHPQVGTSMRPGDPMSLSQRALIRDWIQQLPPSEQKTP